MELRARGLVTLKSNPGDFSEAVWHLVAGMIALNGDVRVPSVCVDPARTGVLKYLILMGAPLRMENHRWEDNRPLVDFHSLPPKKLFPIRVQPHDMPYLLSDLAALLIAVACADGTSLIPYVSEAEPMLQLLNALGVRVEREGETLKITGQPSFPPVSYSSSQDDILHALAIAQLHHKDSKHG